MAPLLFSVFPSNFVQSGFPFSTRVNGSCDQGHRGLHIELKLLGFGKKPQLSKTGRVVGSPTNRQLVIAEQGSLFCHGKVGVLLEPTSKLQVINRNSSEAIVRPLALTQVCLFTDDGTGTASEGKPGAVAGGNFLLGRFDVCLGQKAKHLRGSGRCLDQRDTKRKTTI